MVAKSRQKNVKISGTRYEEVITHTRDLSIGCRNTYGVAFGTRCHAWNRLKKMLLSPVFFFLFKHFRILSAILHVHASVHSVQKRENFNVDSRVPCTMIKSPWPTGHMLVT